MRALRSRCGSFVVGVSCLILAAAGVATVGGERSPRISGDKLTTPSPGPISPQSLQSANALTDLKQAGTLLRTDPSLAHLELQVGPPLRADYRKVPSPPVRKMRNVVAIGPNKIPGREAGSIAGGGACTGDSQCADCNLCTTNECDLDTLTCVITVLDGNAPGGCDDGLVCNGLETCVVGVCTPGTPEDCGSDVCVENINAVGGRDCVPACKNAGDCDDGLACTTDDCDGGVCVHTNACGPGGDCNEFDGGVCGEGRCCDIVGTCSSATFADCNTAGGTWLATEDACLEIEPSGNSNICPKYGAGISPNGDFIASIGPISNLSCDTLWEIGDDYQTENWPESEFMDITFLRFAAGVIPDTVARWSITFYDEKSTRIEDVFWPDGVDQGSATFGINFLTNTVDFDPPLTIPTKGFVTFSVQENFSPDGRVSLLATDAVDVGVNNPDVMWVNGAAIGAGDSGPLPPGSRVLAIEIIGVKTGRPDGACCTGFETAECIQELPWVCEAEAPVGSDGQFQGAGVLCRACSNDVFTACEDNVDCPDTCDNDTSIDCSPEGGGVCIDDGNCVPGLATCFSIFPVCSVSACCSVDGGCTEVFSQGECTGEFQGFGTTCDPNCCTQPEPTGGDNCSIVVLQDITIPAVGDPPVSITVTGNNSGATFDEFPDFADLGIFNPDGGTRDPGWWEGFRLKGPPESCAEIRLDLCCSDANGEPVRPAWGFLTQGCPLDTFPFGIGVDPPIGIGAGTSGFARGGPFCGEDNLWQTFTALRPGEYFYPILSYPGSTCASPPGCDYQLHVTVAACPVAACCTGEACVVTNEPHCRELEGYWLHDSNTGTGTVVNCGSGTPEDPDICSHGSCCTGPGQCEDRADGQTECDLDVNPDTCMDKVLCTVLGFDAYIGGALCANPTPPCPVCEIAAGNNCSPLNETDFFYWQMSDLSMPPDGVITADDFVASGTSISTICTWGAYLERNGTDTDNVDCSDRVTDDFRVRIYLDDGNGRPDSGNIFAETGVSSFVVGAVDNPAGEVSDVVLYEYQMILGPPITGLTPDTTYWIEIVNNTVEDDTCLWSWQRTDTGNNYGNVTTETHGYIAGSERSADASDYAWCLDQSITFPDQPAGQCCDCDGVCEPTTLADCTDRDPQGQWNEPDPAILPNDDCVNATPVTGNSLLIATDTTCATLDGPPTLGTFTYGADIWYAYTATCTGKTTFSMCMSGGADSAFDTAVVVYRNSADPQTCACPPDAVLTGGTALDADEGCDTIVWGSDGFLQPPPVLPGDCLMVRVMGWEAEAGRAFLNIKCAESDCPPSLAPVIEILSVNDSDQAINKVRNLAFSVPNSGDRAVRVVLDNLPSPHDVANGLALWVNAPKEVCENSGQGFSIPIEDCGPAPGLPSATYMVATLGCDPVYRDWSGDGVINVYGELVVPNGDYIIQVIDAECPPALEDSFSEPLLYSTSIWGDMLDDCTSTEGITPCGAPDKSVDITADVSACLGKFGNVQHLQASRADIEPGLLDGEVNISDVTFVLNAFASAPYPFAAPVLPCGSVTSSGSD